MLTHDDFVRLIIELLFLPDLVKRLFESCSEECLEIWSLGAGVRACVLETEFSAGILRPMISRLT